jgi:hypothetical protein
MRLLRDGVRLHETAQGHPGQHPVSSAAAALACTPRRTVVDDARGFVGSFNLDRAFGVISTPKWA